MTIEKDRMVSIEYVLKGSDGVVIDSSDGEALVYFHGNGNLIPGLEKELDGKKAGDKISCSIKPEDAYGIVDPELVFTVSKSDFAEPEKIEVGMQFETHDEMGSHIVTVSKIEGDSVTVDANHPLAGQTLFFDVEVIDVHEPTAEELEEMQSHHSCGCGCGEDDCDCGCDGDCDDHEKGSDGCGCGCH